MITPSLNLDLVRQLRNYHPESFVDRKTELETIHEKVRQAQTENMIVEPVINFWGVGGIGKTWLLRHLEYTYNIGDIKVLVNTLRKLSQNFVPVIPR